MSSSRSLQNCRLCASSSLLSVLDLGQQALTGVFPANPQDDIATGPLELVLCTDCQLLQLGDSFDPDEMYGDNYGYRSGLNASMVEHLTRKAIGLQTLVGLKSGDTILDIGSNDATTLKAYTQEGLKLIGIDPTAGKFLEHYPTDAQVVTDFFNAANYEKSTSNKAKIITSIAMFYDLESPVQFAKDVAACLAPDGVWHFEQSYMPSMLRTTSYDTVCHEHLEYYSLGVIRQILDEAKMEIADVRFNRINGGSFAVTACHKGANVRSRKELVDWFLENERRLGLHSTRPYRDFEDRVFQHKNDLTELIQVLVKSGSTVMGLGASTKGNVLLQFCGLGPSDITAIGEVNPYKYGRVTPGTHIPIISEDEARAQKPDYFLVLPWHFREGIIEREREYLRNGGRLIFPLPEIEIVGD